MYQNNIQDSPENEYTTQISYSQRAILKDKAKGALAGKYTRAALSVLIIGVVTLAMQLAVEFIAGFILGIVFIARTLSNTSLTPDQLAVLLQQGTIPESYSGLLFVIDYGLIQFSSLFTTIFQAGSALFCLNLACGREARISDIFYGYRYAFRKSFSISAVYVLISQLYLIPANVLNYYVRQEFDPERIVLWSAILVVGAILFIPLSLCVSQSFYLLLDFPDQSAGELIKLSVRIMEGQKGRLFILRLSFLPLMVLSLFTIGVGNLFLTPYMNVTYALFFLKLMHSRAEASEVL